MPDGSSPFNKDPLKQGAASAPLGVVGASVRTLVRQAFALLGLALIAIAIPIAFVTPLLPIGLPIAILGVVLLGRNSLWAVAGWKASWSVIPESNDSPELDDESGVWPREKDIK